jgi:hypothetical protein
MGQGTVSWGKLPLGHFINATGKLAANPINDEWFSDGDATF